MKLSAEETSDRAFLFPRMVLLRSASSRARRMRSLPAQPTRLAPPGSRREKPPLRAPYDAGGGLGDPEAKHNRLRGRVAWAVVANQGRRPSERCEAGFSAPSRRSQVGATRACTIAMSAPTKDDVGVAFDEVAQVGLDSFSPGAPVRLSFSVPDTAQWKRIPVRGETTATSP